MPPSKEQKEARVELASFLKGAWWYEGVLLSVEDFDRLLDALTGWEKPGSFMSGYTLGVSEVKSLFDRIDKLEAHVHEFRVDHDDLDGLGAVRMFPLRTGAPVEPYDEEPCMHEASKWGDLEYAEDVLACVCGVEVNSEGLGVEGWHAEVLRRLKESEAAPVVGAVEEGRTDG